MSIDYKNTTEDLIQGVLNHGPSILSDCLYSDSRDIQQYIERISAEHLNYPTPKDQVDSKNWFIPKDYCPDLIESIYSHCQTDEQKNRVNQELELFVKHDMLNVLYAMKFIVDTLRAHNVVWGVGRGSSVASYVLYLIGVHKIDSIKYNLPIEEFFKEI